MDVLSDAIMIMRSGRPRSARVAWRAPWGQRFPAVPGSAGFQVILQGSCRLIPPAGAPVALRVGDVVFFPHGHGYGLADSAATPLAEPACDPLEDAELFVSDSVGHDGPLTVTLCGGYRLDPRHAHPLLHDLPEVIHLPARPGHHPELRAAVDLLGNEVGDPRLGADTVVLALLDMLLLYILRAWFEELPAPARATGWAAALADPAVGSALQAVHRDFAHPWTVQTLAARAGLSRAAFSRRFAALTGRPPLTYVTWWRLTVAAGLLRTTDTPIGEVASRIGYTSEFAFANAFKRHYGTAPGKYRRQNITSPVREGGPLGNAGTDV
ncbi:AraC family transcriptional regulator [Planobispora longispora]|uniref:AraC family transcriptional regulator n=1 Tax=Planobispora longispora TaxID=28887 RepID=A0A8J3RMK0_9ACTN|nr:AraC family transcriptional regulator [Planobispora longispora]GIH76836.1 AraC family transcriptional regulator [Planobispora longispora]